MPPKHVFFIVRFSVLFPANIGVKTANQSRDPNDYRNRLFSPNRLEEKLHLFNQITLRSLIAQTSSDAQIHLIILTSDALPTTPDSDLQALVGHAESEGIQSTVLYIKSHLTEIPERDPVFSGISQAITHHITEIFRSQGGEHLFATVRLDDDDGLSANYCANLIAYVDRGLCGIPVSFAYGYQGNYDPGDGSLENIKHLYSPKIALGLAFTNKFTPGTGYFDDRIHVYNLGPHKWIDQKCGIILDSTFPAYFRTLGFHNDSGNHAYHEHLHPVTRKDFDSDGFSFLSDTIYLVDTTRQSDLSPLKSTRQHAQLVKQRNDLRSLRKKLRRTRTPQSLLSQVFARIRR